MINIAPVDVPNTQAATLVVHLGTFADQYVTIVNPPSGINGASNSGNIYIGTGVGVTATVAGTLGNGAPIAEGTTLELGRTTGPIYAASDNVAGTAPFPPVRVYVITQSAL